MTMERLLSIAIAGAIATAGFGTARAGEPVADLIAEPAETVVERGAAGGQYLALTLAPSVGAVAAVATGYGGYDAARSSAVMVTYADAHVWGPIAVRGGAELSDTVHRLRPSIGARLQLLSQARHGVDGAVAVTYRAEGFNEPEGEIETVLSAGRRMGRTMLIGNVAYGQDPEARERDGELRAAVLVRVGQRAAVGFDARWRFDLGSETAKLVASREPTYDVNAGPMAALPFGPVALIAHAGVSAFHRVGERVKVGAVALAGVGTSF
jgi:hypothetical protein